MAPTKKKSVTLRWRRQANETGLANAGQGPRGWNLHWGPNQLGYVRPRYEGWGRRIVGWYFVARNDDLGIPLENTASAPAASPEAAREQAAAYVVRHLSAARPDHVFKVAAVRGASRERSEG